MTKKGFTLIEILIVIAVIGLLAVAFLPSIFASPQKGRDAARIETVQKIADFFTMQYAEGGAFPTKNGYLDPSKKDTAGHPAKVLNDNIAAFGGVFPLDADPNKCFTGADPYDPGCVASRKGFYFGAFNSTSVPTGYKFVISSRLEESGGGNATNWKTPSQSGGDYYSIFVE